MREMHVPGGRLALERRLQVPLRRLGPAEQQTQLTGINATGKLGRWALMSAYAHQLPDELVCRDILHPDSDSVRQRAHMYRRILQGAVDDVGDEYRESGLKVMMRRIVVPKEASFVGMVVVSGNVGLGELDMAADGQRPIDEIHMQAMDIANRDLEAWCSSHLFALTPEPSAE